MDLRERIFFYPEWKEKTANSYGKILAKKSAVFEKRIIPIFAAIAPKMQSKVCKILHLGVTLSYVMR